MQIKALKDINRIYFIGIGGISMSALAKFMSVYGYHVSGSDAHKSEETDNLAFYGIKVYIGTDRRREELHNADAVVYTDAVNENNEELKCAIESSKTIYSRAEFLSLISERFSSVLAIAGSHGKTTCTSMCAHVFKYVGLPFTAHIGGEDSELGNFYTSGSDYFLTEACEYKKNLLKLKPHRAIVLNVDRDHMECYKDEEELLETFRSFVNRAQAAFVCADDENCLRLGDFANFGIKNTFADYRATEIRSNGEKYSFTVEEYGKALCRVKLNAIGKCHIYNALATFAAMRSYGLNEKEIVKGLETFTAVKRRFEKIGEYKGINFICDYAHHPREIISTLGAAEGIKKGRVFVVFQPHTYSRTKLLFKDFVEALYPVKNLIVYKTYSAREKYDPSGSAETLANALGSLYADNAYVLKTWIQKTAKEGDTILFLGAGDIYYVAQYLLKDLS